ncbi:MAG: hypothetical protein DRH32_00030 [Deltaproteobacteria bacterium]|nr:MAG: hypothetical protein DRH32_00030 [Deltaproteobacteria bacterium]
MDILSKCAGKVSCRICFCASICNLKRLQDKMQESCVPTKMKKPGKKTVLTAVLPLLPDGAGILRWHAR